jgi:hypothetical protein
MERKMRTTFAVLCCLFTSLVLSPALYGADQPQKPSSKLEAMLNAAEMPFNKTGEGRYIAVISVDQNESERFHIQLNYLGNDPNDEHYQIVQMYFLLGQIPKGSTFPTALIKQINEWNSNLTMGRVVAAGTVIMYASSSWLAKTDADTLALDAALGHYASENLRKEVAPYLKQ